jgi:hypothetical protein
MTEALRRRISCSHTQQQTSSSSSPTTTIIIPLSPPCSVPTPDGEQQTRKTESQVTDIRVSTGAREKFVAFLGAWVWNSTKRRKRPEGVFIMVKVTLDDDKACCFPTIYLYILPFHLLNISI